MLKNQVEPKKDLIGFGLGERKSDVQRIHHGRDHHDPHHRRDARPNDEMNLNMLIEQDEIPPRRMQQPGQPPAHVTNKNGW